MNPNNPSARVCKESRFFPADKRAMPYRISPLTIADVQTRSPGATAASLAVTFGASSIRSLKTFVSIKKSNARFPLVIYLSVSRTLSNTPVKSVLDAPSSIRRSISATSSAETLGKVFMACRIADGIPSSAGWEPEYWISTISPTGNWTAFSGTNTFPSNRARTVDISSLYRSSRNNLEKTTG
jgi:hypothetical protein